MKVCLFRKAHFNAAHRLYNKNWSDEKNLEVFGKCSNPNFHGHNYEMAIGIKGAIQEDTGYVISLNVLKKIIHDQIIEYFDHKNLNVEIPEFQVLNPTVENISVVIWNRLRPHIPENLELTVELYETPRNFAIYKGE